MRFSTSDNYADGLLNVIDKKDKRIFTHVQNIDPIMKKAYELRKDDNKGFSKDRTMQKIGTIPIVVALQHPEWVSNPKLIRKFLNSEEGSVFRTVRNQV